MPGGGRIGMDQRQKVDQGDAKRQTAREWPIEHPRQQQQNDRQRFHRQPKRQPDRGRPPATLGDGERPQQHQCQHKGRCLAVAQRCTPGRQDQKQGGPEDLERSRRHEKPGRAPDGVGEGAD